MQKRGEDFLAQAKQENVTGFNHPGAIHKLNSETIDFGKHSKWSINGDRTVTDHTHGHMWTQAPWGMLWNGRSFDGEPLKISWANAVYLFGKGNFAGCLHDGHLVESRGRMTKEDFEYSDKKKGYTKGKCKVEYAGFSDWRLPTAAEWLTIQFFSESNYPLCLPSESDEFKYYDFRREVTDNLFPYAIEKEHSGYGKSYWSATGKFCAYMIPQIKMEDLDGKLSKFLHVIDLIAIVFSKIFNPRSKKLSGSHCNAWSMDFKYNLDEYAENLYPIMLVRDSR